MHLHKLDMLRVATDLLRRLEWPEIEGVTVV
jgi:hypothetical protein